MNLKYVIISTAGLLSQHFCPPVLSNATAFASSENKSVNMVRMDGIRVVTSSKGPFFNHRMLYKKLYFCVHPSV